MEEKNKQLGFIVNCMWEAKGKRETKRCSSEFGKLVGPLMVILIAISRKEYYLINHCDGLTFKNH